MIKKENIFTIIILFFIIFPINNNCKKEKVFLANKNDITFSIDTVLFDTVFTTIGSTYRKFSIKNNSSKIIEIPKIYLKQGLNSQFRVNVDGESGIEFNNIIIQEFDSVVIFAEVTVDPNEDNLPFVIEDKIVVNFSENKDKEIILVAWGQNAYFHQNEIICNEIWKNDKPHVLYGITAVGFKDVIENCVLTIEQNTKIYCHNNSFLYIYKSSLNIDGTNNNPVVFQGDRMEREYENVAGAWNGIYFFQANESNIDWMILKNSFWGIRIDTANIGYININHSKIINNEYSAIYTQGAKLKCENTLISNAGTHLASINIGGDIQFNHCTFSNKWTKSVRNTASIMIKNYYYSIGNIPIHRDFTNLQFTNSIIWGNNDDELEIDSMNNSSLNYKFQNTILKYNNTNNIHIINVLNSNPLFESDTNFNLQNNSPAIDFSNPLFPLNSIIDLKNYSRIGVKDAGAYEKE